MNIQGSDSQASPPKQRFDRLHVALLVVIAVLLTSAGTFWAVKTALFPSEFRPVTLSAREAQDLDAKLARLESPQAVHSRRQTGAGNTVPPHPIEPEPYTEEGAEREIALTERELNALLARNTDLADRLAVDLSADLISARLLVPMDPDFPVLGGRTLNVRAGIEFAYRSGKPVVILKGVSVMGVPMPAAWLGGIKNIDLVREFGGEAGFWRSFAEGVEDVHVEDGRLIVRLRP